MINSTYQAEGEQNMKKRLGVIPAMVFLFTVPLAIAGDPHSQTAVMQGGCDVFSDATTA